MNALTTEDVQARKIISLLGRENPSIKAVDLAVKFIIWREDPKEIVDSIIKNALMMRFVSDDKVQKAIEYMSLRKRKSAAITLSIFKPQNITCNTCGARKNQDDFNLSTEIINGVSIAVMKICKECFDVGDTEKDYWDKIKEKYDVDNIVTMRKTGMIKKDIAKKHKCALRTLTKILNKYMGI